MIKLNEKAAAVLTMLTRDLAHPGDPGDGSCRRVGKKGGAIMQVVVERISDKTYSVAHYYEQNGDLMRDPEMVFLKSDDGWYPVYFLQDNVGVEQYSVDLDGDRPVRVVSGIQADHAEFANEWMRNIQDQQPGWFSGQEDSR